MSDHTAVLYALYTIGKVRDENRKSRRQGGEEGQGGAGARGQEVGVSARSLEWTRVKGGQVAA